MAKNRRNQSKKGGVKVGLTPKRGAVPSSEGPAFAESLPPAGSRDYLMQELAVQRMLLTMSELQGLSNPDPILRAEGKSISTYRQMVDGHLDSVMSKRYAAVRARPWTIERGEASARATNKVREIFDNLDVRTMVYNTLTSIGMGHSVQEVVWDIDDWLVPSKVSDRPQEWFRFGMQGQSWFLSDHGGVELMPPRKLLIARHRADHLNPYGRPVLSSCFWPLVAKRGGLKWWMMFSEKFGLPKTVGKVPASMGDAEKLDLLIRLDAMTRAAAAVIPEGTSVELLETKVSGTLPFPALVKWADSEMSKAWLGETLSTEIQGQGSRAAAETHNEVRADLALDDANLVESTMNELIRWIWEVNSVPGPMPWFAIQMPEDLQGGRLDRDRKLYSLGVRFSQAYFQDVYSIAPEHIARIANDPAGAGTPGPAFASPEDPDEQDNGEAALVELLETLAPEELQGQMETALAPLLEAIDKGTSFAEVESALDRLIPDLPTEQFQAAMTKLLLLAESKGSIDADG
jgi:phage gp29-like protein